MVNKSVCSVVTLPQAITFLQPLSHPLINPQISPHDNELSYTTLDIFPRIPTNKNE